MNANKICIQYIFQTEELSSRFTLTIFIISLIDINSLTASDRATYSAYVEAFVTHLCFLDFQPITFPYNLITYPEVDFLSKWSPVQLAST